MKKIILLLLSFSIIFNSFSIVSADSNDASNVDDSGLKIDKNIIELQPTFTGGSKEEENVYNSINFNEPLFTLNIDDKELIDKASILFELGIIGDIEDIKGVISKAQFVSWVTRLVNLPYISVDRSKYFTDVNGMEKFSVEIEAAADRGIISGDNGRFYPENNITFNECISVIMKAIGYKTLAELKGGYPNGYILTAKQSGVLGNTNFVGDDEINNEFAINILYNALNAEIFEQRIFSNEGVTFQTGKTVLEQYHDVFIVKGQITANNISSIRGFVKTETQEIRINNDTYKVAHGKKYNDYLGYTVKAYVRNVDDIVEIISIIKDSNTKELKIDASDVYKFEDYTYHYGKNSKKKIARNHTFILNGIRQTEYTLEQFCPDNGEVIILHRENQPEADIVIVNEYYPFLLDRFLGTDNDELEFISVNSGVKFRIDPNKEEQEHIFSIGGRTFDINSQYVILQDGDGVDYRQNILPDIPTPSILNIFADKYMDINGVKVPADDAKFIKIVITDKTISGKVKSVSLNGNKVTIDDDEYELSKRNLFLLENKQFEANISGKFFFDYNDQIVAWLSDSHKDGYGYLIAAACEDNGFGEYSLQLKILDANGKVNIYDCRNKLQLNGFVKDDLSEVYTALLNSAAYTHNDGRISQVIRFELNDNSEVRKLDIMEQSIGYNKKENQITRNLSKETLHSRSENGNSLYTPEGVVLYNAGCKIVFSVPEGKSNDDSDFYLMDRWGADRLARVVEVYETDENLIPGVIVVYRAPKDEMYKPYFMVDHVEHELDENGDVRAVVYGTNGDYMQNVSYIAESVDVVAGLNCGDFVKLYGKNNVITDYDLLMSVEMAKNFNYSNPYNATGTACVDLFELYSVYMNNYIVIQRGDIVENGIRSHQQCNYVDVFGANNFIYDATNKRNPTTGYFYNPEYLDTALNDGLEKASKVFIYTASTVPQYIVVYKGI